MKKTHHEKIGEYLTKLSNLKKTHRYGPIKAKKLHSRYRAAIEKLSEELRLGHKKQIERSI